MGDVKKGYVKVFRGLQESAIWLADESFDKRSAWLDLILMANYKEKSQVIGMHKRQYLRGRVYTSDRILATRWHWSRTKVRRFLELLIQLDMVSVDKTTLGTVITIVNYGIYQDGDAVTETTFDTTNETTTDTTTETLLKKDKRKIKKEKKKDSALGERVYEK